MASIFFQVKGVFSNAHLDELHAPRGFEVAAQSMTSQRMAPADAARVANGERIETFTGRVTLNCDRSKDTEELNSSTQMATALYGKAKDTHSRRTHESSLRATPDMVIGQGSRMRGWQKPGEGQAKAGRRLGEARRGAASWKARRGKKSAVQGTRVYPKRPLLRSLGG